MTKLEQLYNTFGELLYVIAKADGIIQNEEYEALNELLKNHTWAKEIKWSFDYESKKDSDIENIYNKVINFCHAYGPTPVYEEFIEAMTIIAESSKGIEKSESDLINSFSADLIKRFQKDLNKI